MGEIAVIDPQSIENLRALNPDDGKLKWYFQHAPGESLDLDEVFERVLIDHGLRHGNGHDRWTTVGASPSIIEASLVALVDGIEHGLWLARATRKGDRDEGNSRLAAG